MIVVTRSRGASRRQPVLPRRPSRFSTCSSRFPMQPRPRTGRRQQLRVWLRPAWRIDRGERSVAPPIRVCIVPSDDEPFVTGVALLRRRWRPAGELVHALVGIHREHRVRVSDGERSEDQPSRLSVGWIRCTGRIPVLIHPTTAASQYSRGVNRTARTPQQTDPRCRR